MSSHSWWICRAGRPKSRTCKKRNAEFREARTSIANAQEVV
jgi:hypothetical protein